MSKLQNLCAGIFLAAATSVLSIASAHAQAGIFEVVHPDVEKGEIEIEVLNGFGLSGVAVGEERSAHEFAIGYGLTDFWKFTVAVEVANPRGDNATIEGFELENLLLFPFLSGHHHDEEGGEEHHPEFALGFFTALEIPREEGISEGALELGPVFELGLGPVEWVGNLLVEVPFGDEDPGLAYASQLVLPVSEHVSLGVENFGSFEEVFGGGNEQTHVAGPAVYFDFDLPNGHKLEPRAAVLFGLNDTSPDAVLSFNIEYKFGG